MSRAYRLRNVPRWMPIGLVLAVVLACIVYTRLGDSYVVTAVATAPASESKSFDLGSLSGLASLGGGGGRTNFEEFVYRINSDANVRAVLATNRYAAAVSEFSALGGPELTLLNVEQAARALFGKDPKVIDQRDRLAGIVQKHIQVKKTPEGYFTITLTGGRPDDKLSLLSALIEQADQTARQRAIVDYKGRIATYQRLVDNEQRPAERTILVSLVAREYTNYASTQSGHSFAFDYVNAPDRVTKVYAPGFLVILIGMSVFWSAVCVVYLIVKRSFLRP